MRKEKALISVLQGLIELVSEEAARNADFAARLESLLEPLPEKVRFPKKKRVPKAIPNLPDIYTERNARGSTEFRMWLANQPIGMPRALIRHHDLDATRRTSKWKDPAKFSKFIADQLESRLARGSSFLRTVDDS